MAARPRQIHRCSACGAESSQWTGRCGTCNEWNTLVVALPHPVRAAPVAPLGAAAAVPIDQVPIDASAPVPTGITEFDRVLAGGIVPGSVTLISGEPGIGKSTLLLQVAAGMAAADATVLYAAAEEAPTQVRRRAERLGISGADLLVTAEAEVAALTALVRAAPPQVLIVDSIQAVFDAAVSSASGSVAQVRACAHALAEAARSGGVAVILVGHVTKDGALAGPRVLEHLVDTVLSFEGDRHQGLRFLRAPKHRFGPTDELGVFTMAEQGLEGVADAGGLFLEDRRPEVAGSLVVPLLDGVRPLLAEVQALVVPSRRDQPRSPVRSVQGLDRARLDLVLAVLQQRCGLPVSDADVFASVAGGLRAHEPGVDLAVALAVASATLNRPIPADVVACGEIGLAGELRQVRATERRLAEAARLGFRRAVVPASTPPPSRPIGIDWQRAPDLATALDLALGT